MSFNRISYSELNTCQQESYNFQKVSSILAEYGFTTMRLSDDWQGADFIAQHIDGNTFLKVQLKGRLTLDKKYIGKDIWICFRTDEGCCIYEHDSAVTEVETISPYQHTKSWQIEGGYSFGSPSSPLRDFILNHTLKNTG